MYFSGSKPCFNVSTAFIPLYFCWLPLAGRLQLARIFTALYGCRTPEYYLPFPLAAAEACACRMPCLRNCITLSGGFLRGFGLSEISFFTGEDLHNLIFFIFYFEKYYYIFNRVNSDNNILNQNLCAYRICSMELLFDSVLLFCYALSRIANILLHKQITTGFKATKFKAINLTLSFPFFAMSILFHSSRCFYLTGNKIP